MSLAFLCPSLIPAKITAAETATRIGEEVPLN